MHIPDYLCDTFPKVVVEVLREVNRDPGSIKAHAKVALMALATLSVPLHKGDGAAKKKKGATSATGLIKTRLLAIAEDTDRIFDYVEILVRETEAHVPIPPPASSKAGLIRAAERKARHGRYGAALQVLGSNGVAEQTEETMARLEKLFPSRDTFEPLSNFIPPPSSEAIEFTTEQVVDALLSFASDSAPGPGGLRASHLKKILTRETGRGQEHLAVALTKYVNNAINAKFPETIAPFWFSSIILPLIKDPNDPSKLRPICIGTLLARLVEKIAARAFAAEAACILMSNNQVAINIKGGSEALIHAFSAVVEAV
jgi:hypothetical protein